MGPSRKPRDGKTASSIPRTPSTAFLYQFRGDLLRFIYLHKHKHTLLEFTDAMNKVFEEIYKVHNIMIEVNYGQWWSRKHQWDKDWNIESGGLSTEIREELEHLPSWLECHDGVLGPKLRQSGCSLVSTLDLEAETDLPATYSQTDPNYMSSRERWPIQHTASQQWNVTQMHDQPPHTVTVGASAHPGLFTHHRHEGFSAVPQSSEAAEASTAHYTSYGLDSESDIASLTFNMDPPGISERNATNSTLARDAAISTYGSLPMHSTSHILDTCPIYALENTFAGINSYPDSVIAAHESDRSIPQEQVRTEMYDYTSPPFEARPPSHRTLSNFASFLGHDHGGMQRR